MGVVRKGSLEQETSALTPKDGMEATGQRGLGGGTSRGKVLEALRRETYMPGGVVSSCKGAKACESSFCL